MTDTKQTAPVGWEAIARQREAELKTESEKRYQAESDLARVQQAACSSAENLRNAEARIVKAAAAIERVRELHQRWDADPASCAHCENGYGSSLPYPCPTIRALDPQEPTTTNCVHPEGYKDECPCPPSCTCCQPTTTEASQ